MSKNEKNCKGLVFGKVKKMISFAIVMKSNYYFFG